MGLRGRPSWDNTLRCAGAAVARHTEGGGDQTHPGSCRGGGGIKRSHRGCVVGQVDRKGRPLASSRLTFDLCVLNKKYEEIFCHVGKTATVNVGRKESFILTTGAP